MPYMHDDDYELIRELCLDNSLMLALRLSEIHEMMPPLPDDVEEADGPRPPIYYHGGRGYSLDGETPQAVSWTEHDILQKFQAAHSHSKRNGGSTGRGLRGTFGSRDVSGVGR